jgi:DNA-binding transcriptional MerR regulator
MIRTFTAGQASRISGVPYRTLDFWARSGFLAPSAQQANGRGSERRYTVSDLFRLMIAKRLRDGGLSLATCKMILRIAPHNPLDDRATRNLWLLSDFTAAWLLDSAEEVLAYTTKKKLALWLVVNLRSMAQELKAKVEEMRS